MAKVDVRVRAEAAADHAAVRRVNEAAFGRPAEADLVDALRRAVPQYVSRVAEVEGAVVGHILFTPVAVGAPRAAVGLAPMAVWPALQGRGIGTALVLDGLRMCERAGYGAVFVLGHPDYYPRFGFVPARTHGFASTYDVPDEAFMVLELKPGALAGEGGTVHYHPAFDEVG